MGELRVARVATAYFGEAGLIAVASSRPGFPHATDKVLLRAAASLAGSAFANARLMLEREAALRSKDEFLAMLGHELRNSLAPIVTALCILRLRSPAGLSTELQIVDRQVRHMVGLVDDLLDVARITRGKITLALEDVELAAVVTRAIEMVRPIMEQRRHELKFDVPATGMPLRGDMRRLSQVFSNLLVNAAKYAPIGGHISISAERVGAWLRVSVRDDGIGIEPALLPRLFTLFEQGTTTLDRGHGGLGVGLAIVKTLVTAHAGSIEVKSEGPGRGAERVLVVDDNPGAANLAAALLEAAGHTVIVANDAPGALEICGQWTPTVIVVDIGLPVVDGYQLATLIRERGGERCARLIALTGYGLEADREKSAAAGIETHLVEPNGQVGPALPSGAWNFGTCEHIEVTGPEPWIGCAQGLVRLRRQADGPNFEVGFSADVGFVSNIIRLRGSSVLAVSTAMGLVESVGHTWWRYKCAALAGKRVTCIKSGLRGELLLGTDDGLLVVDQSGEGGVSRIQVPGADPTVTAIAVEGQTYWVAFGYTLAAFVETAHGLSMAEIFKLESPANDLLSDPFENVWVATDSSGLAKVSCLRHALQRIDLGRSGGVYSIKTEARDGYAIGGDRFFGRAVLEPDTAAAQFTAIEGLPETVVWDSLQDGDITWAVTTA